MANGQWPLFNARRGLQEPETPFSFVPKDPKDPKTYIGTLTLA
ncbi:hypothetical protein Vi05172_g13203 [Venturia inaequalis]|nr:hypothetical protein Vi05172_g13203 [Venturia inaequalis]